MYLYNIKNNKKQINNFNWFYSTKKKTLIGDNSTWVVLTTFYWWVRKLSSIFF